MERKCKNCGHMLYAGHSHCASCGAKWIENRITMRQVGMDFTDMYIGLDTKFAHTFLDLFRRPGKVINGYINGRRMYYMDAVRYLLLALFVTGIYVFVIRNSGAFEQYLTEIQAEMTRMGMANANEQSLVFQNKLQDILFDYQGLMLLLTIPLFALAGRITFWKKTYFNYTEQIVFYMYAYGHMVIVTTPISILLLFVSPEIFTYWSFVGYIFLFLHSAYSYKECFGLDISTTILKSLIGIIVFSILMVISMIGIIILGVICALVAEKVFGIDMSVYFA